MRRSIAIIFNIAGTFFMLSTVCSVLVTNGFAQVGPPRSQQPGSQANPLPLSGRTAQNGSVTATQTPVPGTTTSVNTINPTVQIQGPYSGSIPSTARLPFSGRLSLREAIQRGLEYNLGAVGLTQLVRQTRGQEKSARGALMPNISASLNETVEQLNLTASGLRISSPIPGFSLPSIVGPFNVFDARASLSQSVVDLTAWHNYRSASETARAGERLADDARDLIVLAVGGSYLQVIAAKARVESAQAQVETANALYQQAAQQRAVGVLAQVDVNRSQVQLLTQQQRLLSLQNDLAKQKISLARLTGVPVSDLYDISDDVPFSPAPPLTLEEALKQAFEHRSDLKAAQAQVRAANQSISAARAERLPSFSINADYGAIGTTPFQSHGTFAVAATIRIPIWTGGRTEGNILQAEAALTQRQAEFEDLKGRIEGEIRNAYLDLQAAAGQVDIATKNIQVSRQNLDLTRQRFDAGVSDNVDVVQSQEAVSTARLDYINSVFAHNLAKLSLARALGRANENLTMFLKLQ